MSVFFREGEMRDQTVKNLLNSNLCDIEHQLSMCIKCKMCTYSKWPQNDPMCPPYDKYRFFTYCGGGMLYLGKALDLGLIPPSQELIEVISKCTACGFCGMRCELVKVAPPYFPVHELISVIKAYLIEQEVNSSEKEMAVLDSLRRNRNPFFASPEAHKTVHKPYLNPDSKIYLFVGCTNTFKTGEILEASVAILEKAGVHFSLLDDEICCGAPLLDMGYRKDVVELAEQNMKQIEKSGAEKIIFLCPHCLSTFKSVYPKINGIRIGARLMFISQFVLELANEGRLTFPKSTSSKKKVAFHDPCYLARYVEDVESVRKLFERIPSIEVIENDRSRYETYCCGAGGGSRLADPDYSAGIAMERTGEFIRTGAEELITACPHCKGQFMSASENIREELEVKDAMELVSQYL